MPDEGGRRGACRKALNSNTRGCRGPRERTCVSVFGFLDQLMQALSGVLAHGTELRVRAVPLCEVIAVFPTKCADQGIRALLADLAGLGGILVSCAVVETSGEVFS